MMDDDSSPVDPSSPLMQKPARSVLKVKASRQSYSCAECKRLKLKCSRTWPCTSCTKRGCAQICPAGEMRTGKGKRLILADTEELHQRIAKLEIALAHAHALNSAEPHPMLSSAYLFAPRDRLSAEPYHKQSALDKRDVEREEMVDGSFGTLTIGPEGQAVFVGNGAGSEFLREDQPNAVDPRTPPPKRNIYQSPLQETPNSIASETSVPIDTFPFKGSTLSLERLRDSLPDWDTEGRLCCESYWDNVSWLFDVIPRKTFDSDHLLSAYSSAAPPHAHKLACVFFVMALGALFDLHRPTYDPRADQLCLLGRACLSSTGLESSSIATVQALMLYGTFALNSKDPRGAEILWTVLGSASKVAISLGLHRDGAAFGLAEHEVVERRKSFYELVMQERLQALCFARPGSMSSKFTDTKRPGLDADSAPDSSAFHDAKFRVAEIIERVIEDQTRIGPAPYSAILQLDDDLLALQNGLHEKLLPASSIQALPTERMLHPHLVLHRLVIRLLVDVSRLYLHRPSFARALKDDPEDPSGTKFAPSFVALYESAYEVVTIYKQLIMYHPSLVARFWFLHFHTFSAAVCLSAIAIRAPRCAFATPALQAMTIVTDLCIAAHESSRAKNGLPILLRLRQRAQASLAEAISTAKPAAAVVGRGDDLSHLAESIRLRRLQHQPSQPAIASPDQSVASWSTGLAQYGGSHTRTDSLQSRSSATTAPSITPWFGPENHPPIDPSLYFGDLASHQTEDLYGLSYSQAFPAASSDQAYSDDLLQVDSNSQFANAYTFDLDNFMMQLDRSV